MIRSIKFVSIPVADQSRALDFYSERLGFTVVTDQPFDDSQRWIELKPPRGDTKLVLFTPDGRADRIGEFQPLSLECDDVRKTHGELVARGVEFAAPPTEEHWGVFAIMKDSEGNQIVLSSRS